MVDPEEAFKSFHVAIYLQAFKDYVDIKYKFLKTFGVIDEYADTKKFTQLSQYGREHANEEYRALVSSKDFILDHETIIGVSSEKIMERLDYIVEETLKHGKKSKIYRDAFTLIES